VFPQPCKNSALFITNGCDHVSCRLPGGSGIIATCLRPVSHDIPSEAKRFVVRCDFFKQRSNPRHLEELRKIVCIAAFDKSFLREVELAYLLGDTSFQSAFDGITSEVVRSRECVRGEQGTSVGQPKFGKFLKISTVHENAV